MSSLLHRTPPETKTATFGLRVDYILPSRYVQKSTSGTRITLAAHTHCTHVQLQPHPQLMRPPPYDVCQFNLDPIQSMQLALQVQMQVGCNHRPLSPWWPPLFAGTCRCWAELCSGLLRHNSLKQAGFRPVTTGLSTWT
jgi:hypothetical protein